MSNSYLLYRILNTEGRSIKLTKEIVIHGVLECWEVTVDHDRDETQV